MGRPRGSKNKHYKRIIHDGYVHLWNPEHCEAMKNGYVREHRMIISDLIGRKLKEKEQVHHINGIRDDNRVENLELLSIEEHSSHHHRGAKRPRKGSKECWFVNCETLTASKYGLCTKHYKLQWQRLRDEVIGNIYENPELINKK